MLFASADVAVVSAGATRFREAPEICWPSDEPAVPEDTVATTREPVKSSPDRLTTPSCSRMLLSSARAEEIRIVLACPSEVTKGLMGVDCSTWLYVTL